MLLLLLLSVATLLCTAQACSPIEGQPPPRQYTLPELVHLAPVVLVGQVLSLDTHYDRAEFQLYCVFKWDQAATQPPQTITIRGAVHVNSCSNRAPWREGENWLVTLRRHQDTASFDIEEPDDTGAYTSSADNLQTAADVCGVIVRDVVPAGVSFSCPSHTPSDNCTYPTTSPTTSQPTTAPTTADQTSIIAPGTPAGVLSLAPLVKSSILVLATTVVFTLIH